MYSFKIQIYNGLICLVLTIFGLQRSGAQDHYGLELLSRVTTSEHLSSVWGLTHSSGRDLALVGTTAGLRIYDLADPVHPSALAFFQGHDCVWRELKTWKDYVYVVTECDDGLIIIDLSDLGNISVHQRSVYVDRDSVEHAITRAHTLFIDEKGYLYFAGANNNHSGFVILDLQKDPLNPQWINGYDDEYYHEVFVLRDTLYGASIYFGEFVIWDIRDRMNPVRLNTQQTAFRFSHSVWREPVRPVLYTADERNGAIIESWDVSDPHRIRRLGTWRTNTPEDPESIPHNCFFRDSFLFVSWYTEGVRVLDASDPTNLTEVAWYDTHPQKQSGFHGVWNVYAFFKSNILLASDIENGLFVLQFNPSRGTVVKGLVTDNKTGLPISNVKVSFSDGFKTVLSQTNFSGMYQTGFHTGGKLKLTFSAPAYKDLNLDIELVSGSTTMMNIAMEPLEKYSVEIYARHESDQAAEEGIRIKLWNDNFSYESVTNAQGYEVLNNIVEGDYKLQLAKWGRLHYSVPLVHLGSSQRIDAVMKDGYEDQFNIAEDWINIPDTVALQWQRGDFSELSPPPSNYPSADIATDLGRVALYTNNFSDEFSERNVAGHHWLKSPEMDLSAFSDIDLSYDVWAYGGWDSSVKECYLEFDQQRWPLEQIYENLSGQFNRKSSYALDVRNIERKHVRFVIHLWNDPDSIQYAISLKAALDGFKLTGKLINDNDLLGQDPEIEVYPNPAGDFLILRNRIKEPLRIRISDITGCEYYLSSNDEEQFQFSLDDFPPGHYFINLFASEIQKMYTKIFIKAGPEH